MTADLLLAFMAFATVTTVTPGPNNTMLLASGANFGYRRSLPAILGIAAGIVLMMTAVGLGLGGLFQTWPALYDVLRWVGASYLLWLAWRIARAGGGKAGSGPVRPLSFLQSAGFQWVNPKAWLMVIGAVTAYIPRDGYVQWLPIVAGLMGLIAIPCVSLWAGLGQAIGRLLDGPGRLRAFNLTMAALLVLSLYPILFG